MPSIDAYSENTSSNCSIDLYPWLSSPSNSFKNYMRCTSEIQIHKPGTERKFNSPGRIEIRRKRMTPRRRQTPPSYLTTPYSRRKTLLRSSSWKRSMSTYNIAPNSPLIKPQALEKRHSYHFDGMFNLSVTVSPPKKHYIAQGA